MLVPGGACKKIKCVISIIFLLRLLPADANEFAATNAPASLYRNIEEVRDQCIEERRMVCGKILRVLPEGLVVESGYTDLLRPPLTDSWLVPDSVSATRPPNLVENNDPGSPAVGTIFLTDLPRLRGKKVKPYDYVILLAYPAGTYTYTSVGTIRKAVRHFCGNLGAAAGSQIALKRWTEVPLHMPPDINGTIPKLLSQTGVFSDMTNQIPEKYLIPYGVNVPFWSDGAQKKRWVCIPPGELVHFSREGEWTFPPGTVFVKTFEIAEDRTHPDISRRLETRLLVCDDTGGVYGVDYKWRPDNSDADLLETNLTEDISIKTTKGNRRQDWYYPSREDCLVCHTANAGYVLGARTSQLNRDFQYPNGVTENEIVAWKKLGLFDADFRDADVKTFPSLAPMNDLTRSLADRARSYLDANCAGCHRPDGTVAQFDARYETPLADQGIVNGSVLIDERIDGARVVAPNDVWRSLLLLRMNTVGGYQMPPLARNTIDEDGARLLRAWIESLPGPRVLVPPKILPPGGTFSAPVKVTLQSEAGATIYYTLDGTVPTQKDLLYEKPFTIAEPTIVRAKAFKTGCSKSVTAKEFFLFNQ
jgi:uncharacterized repeat protein (TIGR03806 family)